MKQEHRIQLGLALCGTNPSWSQSKPAATRYNRSLVMNRVSGLFIESDEGSTRVLEGLDV